MKVNTDSIILGSWALAQIAQLSRKPRHALDIGSGSGLLSLMLAQGVNGDISIDAVELEKPACNQSVENIKASPWPHAVKTHNSSILDYNIDCQTRYDIIISNPPYFSQITKPSKAFENQSTARQMARNQSSLSFSDLVEVIKRRLESSGIAFIVLPSNQINEFESFLCRSQLHLNKQLVVSASPYKESHITCIGLSGEKNSREIQKLNIYDGNNVYTKEYRTLCKNFYLRF
jgi:tRNA1Val (adenine37-N6)-methyltransferase